MPFTTDQANELIGIIRSIPSGDAKAIADLPRQLITALKEVNTLNEETRKLDTASQIAMERVQDCLRERLEKKEISLSATDQASIDLLFAIHLADDINTDVDQERRTLLERALAIGDVEILNLLKQPYGMDVNAQDENGDTLLHRLLKQRNYTVARWLIEIGGAAVNIEGEKFYTSLHIVAEQGEIGMAEWLVSRGCDVEVLNEDSYSPLQTAIKHGHLNMVELLLPPKESTPSTPTTELSPLDDALRFAVTVNQLEIVKLLIRKGANIHQQDDKNYGLLSEAVTWERWEVFEFLTKDLNLNWQEVIADDMNDGEEELGPHRSLLFASGSGNKKAVEHWLGQGADITAKNIMEETALRKAAEGGHLELVQLLLEKKADIGAKNFVNQTVLYRAVESGSMPLVEYLLEEVLKNGIDINIADSTGQTPLDVAAGRGDLEMTKYLLEKRPKLDDKGEPNFSPLCAAAAANRPKLVEYFLDQETNVEVRNQGKNLALRAAIEGGHLELIRSLLKKGARAGSETMQWLRQGIAPLVADFSINPAAAEKIHRRISSLFLTISSDNFLPNVLRPIIFNYAFGLNEQQEAKQTAEQQAVAAGLQSDITIVLVEQALRILAREIDNPYLAATREERLEKLEAARAEVIAVLGDTQLRAECNLYWKQLKNAFKQIARAPASQSASSASSVSNNFDARLEAAFAAIPTPSTTYVPPSLASLVSMAAQPVDVSKRERKESKEEELESAPLTTSTQSALQIDAPMPAVQITSSSSSSSSSQQLPVIQRYPNPNTDLDLAGFSRAQIQAAIDASLKEQGWGYKSDEKGRGKQERRKRKGEREEEHEQPVKDLGAKPKPKKKGKNVATAAAGKRSQDSADPAQWKSDAVGGSAKEEESEQSSARGYALGAGHFGGTGQSKSKAEKRGREPSNGLGETAEREPVPKKPKDENSAGPSKR